jgi:hypothetical protein
MALFPRFLQLDSPPLHPSLAAVARSAHAVLGGWLAFSGWLFEQPFRGQLNSYAVGIAITLVAINAFWFPLARLLNTAIALWLAWSIKVYQLEGAARINTFAVALLVFLISVFPRHTRDSPERPRLTPR